MGSWIIGPAVAIGLGLGLALLSRRNRALAPAIEAKLRAEAAGMTLPALAESLGMGGFYARGKVAMALNEMAGRGQVEIVPAPDGTPQLEKVDVIRYRWKG